ncbi:MAG: Nif11-like leader peptide family natural product precursor [Fibrobacterota bacterium]|jgi:hypothetical protein|nr:Nif11-like leader peptide family natural product precursor [Fibrobacterota bacterium]QQS04757.1 MAG: Nif11-like leader peptide family natural product precursor [Fibrobacterota bacterium]
MPIQHAIHFLRDLEELEPLRQKLYLCEGREALFAALENAGYSFTGGEFEEAVDHLHVACQSHEQADTLMTRANWFRMVSANA